MPSGPVSEQTRIMPLASCAAVRSAAASVSAALFAAGWGTKLKSKSLV
jgi:hypothetical protein